MIEDTFTCQIGASNDALRKLSSFFTEVEKRVGAGHDIVAYINPPHKERPFSLFLSAPPHARNFEFDKETLAAIFQALKLPRSEIRKIIASAKTMDEIEVNFTSSSG